MATPDREIIINATVSGVEQAMGPLSDFGPVQDISLLMGGVSDGLKLAQRVSDKDSPLTLDEAFDELDMMNPTDADYVTGLLLGSLALPGIVREIDRNTDGGSDV